MDQTKVTICICHLYNTDFDHRGLQCLDIKDMDCHCEDASLQYSQYAMWVEQEMDLKTFIIFRGWPVSRILDSYGN